jgi:L-threonylcarbamoyladenylate synthase
VLLEGPLEEMGARLTDEVRGFAGQRVGVMLPGDVRLEAAPAAMYAWGQWTAPEEMARTLYAGLRALDAEQCTVILCPLPPAEGIGAAMRDRLLKAGSLE